MNRAGVKTINRYFRIENMNMIENGFEVCGINDGKNQSDIIYLKLAFKWTFKL